ncbi:MAG TPA: SMP-30/gluconolactonase/LRE family protein [Bryobacteraceae bacterium]|nr:SMP-30/gluconolactonase/LRE family protein [Bryobacteraceae bacterium]
MSPLRSSLRATLFCALAAVPLEAQQAPPKQFAQPAPVKEVTITAIPGVIDGGVQWKEVWHGDATADGIIGFQGGILFAQEQTNHIGRIDKNGKFSVYLDTPHGPGAVAIGPKGQIYTVERSCTDPGGHLGTKPQDCKEPTDVAVLTPTRKILADNMDGMPLGRVNDIVASKKGMLYFTSRTPLFLNPSTGKVTAFGQGIFPNGLGLSPDEKTLYVTNRQTIMAFDIGPDGMPTNQREFAKLDTGGNGDGMAIDAMGRVWNTDTGNSVIHVFSPDGKSLGTIPTPRSPITVAFSGPGKKTLYVGCMGALIDGKEFRTAPGVRNVAMTVYTVPVLTAGVSGRAK